MFKAFSLALLVAAARMAKADTPALIDEASQAAQEGMAFAAGVALARIGQRAAAGTGALPDLLRKGQELADALRDTEDALATSGADTVMLGGQTRQLDGEIAGLDAKVAPVCLGGGRWINKIRPAAYGPFQGIARRSLG